MVNAAVVGVGGFIGALARYGLSGWIHRQEATSGFPYGTVAVNLLGCLLIGLVAGMAEGRQLFGPEFRLFALIGVLGGFTTYSSFGYESLMLLRDAEYFRIAAYVGLHLVAGVGLVWLGWLVGTLPAGLR